MPAGSAHDAAPDLSALSTALGVDLDPELVGLALTHRSYAYEHGGLPTNERLEFLGDSVLGVVITDALYHAHPDLPEGQLAKLRASIVNMHALAGVGAALGIGGLLRLGRGEELTGGREKPSIVSDAVEAILGAVYLQEGIEAVRGVILRIFDGLLTSAPRLGAGLDWKTSLQELSASRGAGVPEYLLTEEGPDHAKTFTATAVVGAVPMGTGTGHTKKEAEQQAAAEAYECLSAGAAGSAFASAGSAPGSAGSASASASAGSAPASAGSAPASAARRSPSPSPPAAGG